MYYKGQISTSRPCHGQKSYLDVVSSFLGKVVEGLGISRWLLPPWHLMIDNLGLIQDVKVRRVRVQFLHAISILLFASI